ncbi:hypothetical protein HIM_00533 [Hirsutella minnesotensis 3608]|nr:hypothetical protein HIM_00533 [Hirsutella minnesotensis 3608]
MTANSLGSEPPWLEPRGLDASIGEPLTSTWSAPRLVELMRRANDSSPGSKAQDAQGIGILSFLTAIGVAAAVFAVQFALFSLLRNKLARIFKPRTYLVPQRERTEPPPTNLVSMIRSLTTYNDREIINKCGLDAFFFLRYLKTLLVIFIPICCVVLPILIPINYVGGKGRHVNVNKSETNRTVPSGLDTLAWGNVSPANTSRYTAHLVMAILVVLWICTVFFFELRVYIKVRQDYLTSAEHRLRASATTVLVSSIPRKWLSVEALEGLFDAFPGGVRNVWLNRDLTKLLDKISLRKKVHAMLESAETDLIKACKKADIKRRDAEEKKERKEHNLKAMSKEEKAARDAQEDAEADRLANSNVGEHAYGQDDAPQTIEAGLRQPRSGAAHEGDNYPESMSGVEQTQSGESIARGVKQPFHKVGKSIKVVASKAGTDVKDTLGTTNGFVGGDCSHGHTATHVMSGPGEAQSRSDEEKSSALHAGPPEGTYRGSRDASSIVSAYSTTAATQQNSNLSAPKTSPRRVANTDMFVAGKTRFWQFWKPPTGAYTSPIPQGEVAREYMANRSKNQKPLWQRIKNSIPFMGDDDEEHEYALAHNPDHQSDEDSGAEWLKHLKKSERPTHHLPLFGVQWLFGIPFVTKKVDTIYWCREELARLNLEIEDDQKHPERYPLMSSAFIQFNHQVAAHMACQSIVHHIPRQMSPRMNEISPRDVNWDNMALTWWQEWLRTVIVGIIVVAMIFLWALPVAWTAALGQLDAIIRNSNLLGSLKDDPALSNALRAISGVLPAAVLALLLILVPIVFGFLAQFKGAKTGAQKSEFVQIIYFAFLFVQVFLVVSIASFFAKSINEFVKHLTQLQSVSAVLDLLAKNLPASANYFFSYMILQALSTSSGTLLQIGGLFMWFIVAPMFDSTARDKWNRNTKLNQIQWGSFFPVYTNFACIGLVYCVIAPLISIFVVITFSLLWLAQRYAMLYVNRFETDTGGVLYPRAINQTFTGIYFMELCMAGLFFIVQDTRGKHTCTAHGIIMIIVAILTIVYQTLLNKSFAPLFRFLPITFEDEAVLRDEAFQRAQDVRFGLDRSESRNDTDPRGDDQLTASTGEGSSRLADYDEKDIESSRDGPEQEHQNQQRHQLHRQIKQVGHWAKDGGKHVGSRIKDGGNQVRKLGDNTKAVRYRRRQRQRDLEAQRAIGDALYGGLHDDIEDLTPEERDMLTRHAFKHYALRAKRPTVWIPRDDLGVSDDEIRRTHDYSEHIWISNEGTALDSKLRVVYGKNPPDFSEVDIINL